ncbi:hypothetical protein ACLKA7_009984 [Drosophila subpalustris]
MKAKPSEIPKCYIGLGLGVFVTAVAHCFPSASDSTPTAPLPWIWFWFWLPAGDCCLHPDLSQKQNQGHSPSPAAAWAAFDDDGISFGSCPHLCREPKNVIDVYIRGVSVLFMVLSICVYLFSYLPRYGSIHNKCCTCYIIFEFGLLGLGLCVMCNVQPDRPSSCHLGVKSASLVAINQLPEELATMARSNGSDSMNSSTLSHTYYMPLIMNLALGRSHHSKH